MFVISGLLFLIFARGSVLAWADRRSLDVADNDNETTKSPLNDDDDEEEEENDDGFGGGGDGDGGPKEDIVGRTVASPNRDDHVVKTDGCEMNKQSDSVFSRTHKDDPNISSKCVTDSVAT